MHKKHTNLCLSADVTTVDMLLKVSVIPVYVTLLEIVSVLAVDNYEMDRYCYVIFVD